MSTLPKASPIRTRPACRSGRRFQRSAARLAAALCALAAWPALATAAYPGDNGEIAFVRDNAIWTVNPDGTDVRQLTRPPAGVDHWDPAWSPDGTRLALRRVTYAADGLQADAVYTVNADNSGLRRIAAEGDHPTWSPDGRYIAFSGSSGLYVVGSDGTGVKRIREGYVAVPPEIGEDAEEPAWSPTGAWIIFAAAPEEAENGWMHLIRPDGSDEYVFRTDSLAGSYGDVTPSWSPDGAHIAYTARKASGGVTTIDADGQNLRTLAPGVDTADPTRFEWSSDPAWSPDGRFIVYEHESTIRPDQSGLWIMNADGSGKHLLVTDATEPDWQPIPVVTPTPVTPAAPVAPAAGGPSAPAPSPLTVTTSGPRRVRRGAPLRVRVTFSAAQDRTPVRLQHRVGHGWATVRSRTVSGRSVVFAIRLSRLGVHRFRVVHLQAGVRQVVAVAPVRVVAGP